MSHGNTNAAMEVNYDLITRHIAGLPSGHPRHSPMKRSLNETFDYALSLGFSRRNALREAIRLGCASPDSMGMGL